MSFHDQDKNADHNPYAERRPSSDESIISRSRRQQAEAAGFFQDLLTATPHVFMTRLLVAITVLVFIVMVATGVSAFTPTADQMIRWGANFGPKTVDGQWWRLLTCVFLHHGVIHMGINMWILWDVGHLVERLVGNIGFLILYVLCGLFGSLASLWWNPGGVVSAGASGAVFGMFGVMLGFVALRRDSIPANLKKHFMSSGITFLVLNLMIGLSVSFIDNAAHLGGFVAGLLGGMVVSQPLSGEIALGRIVRNTIVFVSGAGLLLAGVLAAPKAQLDLSVAVQRFNAKHSQVRIAYDQLAQQQQNNEITADEFADSIETVVLPKWIEIRKDLEALDVSPGPVADSIDDIIKYLNLQQKSCETRIVGLRRDDAEILKTADTLADGAERKFKSITEKLK